ncbi:hypothetical protein [Guggenheimella bovis]
MTLDKMTFESLEEFRAYEEELWKKGELKELVDSVNDRFEMLLRNAVKVRDEIRTGVRQSDEKISITIYEWISRFMERTKKVELVEGVTIAGERGTLVFDLYKQTSYFDSEVK